MAVSSVAPFPTAPRPSGARPGGPAPWARSAAGSLVGLSLDRVMAALTSAGRSIAHSPVARAVVPADEGLARQVAPRGPGARSTVPAAVLVALFEEHGEARVVLTRRSAVLRNHRGEVCFPGGKLEPGETAAATALREASEEVALDPGAVEVVGWLQPVLTRTSHSLVAPVVARLGARPVLVPNAGEVDRVFDVALADLLVEGAFREEVWPGAGSGVPTSKRSVSTRGVGDDGTLEAGTYPVWFFEVDGETVWGATARVLVDLLSLVAGTAPDG